MLRFNDLCTLFTTLLRPFLNIEEDDAADRFVTFLAAFMALLLVTTLEEEEDTRAPLLDELEPLAELAAALAPLIQTVFKIKTASIATKK